MLSNKQVNRIGDILKNNEHNDSEENIKILIDFRNQFVDPLFGLSLKIKNLLNESKFSFILSGRLKRLKSIIRKLRREQNRHMDLTRMADIAGIRIIVEDISQQESIFEFLKDKLNFSKIFDYRERDQNYKSLHFHVVDESEKTIEIQLRTLGQHTWADESESFGEQSKENTGSKELLEFFSLLSNSLYRLERGESFDEPSNEYFKKRDPINDKYVYLKENFKKKSIETKKNIQDYIFIIVFDNKTKTITYNENFNLNETSSAIDEHKRLSSYLDDRRYEYLFMSSDSIDALKLTHPRFFYKN